MSMWAEYIKERLGKQVLEHDYGFASYCFDYEKKFVYVEDVYIVPERRKQRVASHLIDEISVEAKKKGMLQIFVTVVAGTTGATDSMFAILKYGFKLDSSANNLVLFVKEL